MSNEFLMNNITKAAREENSKQIQTNSKNIHYSNEGNNGGLRGDISYPHYLKSKNRTKRTNLGTEYLYSNITDYNTLYLTLHDSLQNAIYLKELIDKLSKNNQSKVLNNYTSYWHSKYTGLYFSLERILSKNNVNKPKKEELKHMFLDLERYLSYLDGNISHTLRIRIKNRENNKK